MSKKNREIEKIQPNFSEILENINDLVYVINIKGEYEYINEKPHKEIVGYLNEDLIGKRYLNFIYPDDLDIIKSFIDNTFQYGFGNAQINQKHKEGRYILLKIEGKVLLDNNNLKKIIILSRCTDDNDKIEHGYSFYELMVGVNQIILNTNLEGTIPILQESFNIILKFLNLNKGGIYLIDEKKNSAKLIYYLGLTPEFIEKVKFINIKKGYYKKVFIKGKPIISNNYRTINENLSKEENINSLISIPLITKDRIIGAFNFASEEYYVFKKKKRDILQNIGILIGNIIDRKKQEQILRESEEKHRLITENTISIISVYDRNFKLEYINKKPLMEILGYTPEEMIGEAGVNYAYPKDQPLVYEKFRKLLETGKTFVKARAVHKDGHTVWTDSSAIAFKDKNNDVKYLNITTDISKQQKAKELLIKSKKKYKEAYDRAELYKDILAHDINNILQGILSANELCTAFLDHPENQEDLYNNLSVISEQVNRGAKLISNIRKLSQLELFEKSLIQIEIMKILKKSIRLIKKSYQNRNLNIQIDHDGKELYIQANALLQDVFENILINAVNHNKNTIIEIDIRISKEKIEDINYHKIEIIDNGIGIENQQKNKIFQREYTEDKSFSGMGLGLSLVKKIMHSFNGKIRVEDKIKGDHSKGSNFIILIPEVIKNS